MDFLLEILFEIIFEGVIEMTSSRRVPFIIRLILAIVVLAFYLFITGCVMYVGIIEQQIVIFLIGLLIFVGIGSVIVKKFIHFRKNR